MRKTTTVALLGVAMLGNAYADPTESYSGFNNIRFSITDVKPRP